MRCVQQAAGCRGCSPQYWVLASGQCVQFRLCHLCWGRRMCACWARVMFGSQQAPRLVHALLFAVLLHCQTSHAARWGQSRFCSQPHQASWRRVHTHYFRKPPLLSPHSLFTSFLSHLTSCPHAQVTVFMSLLVLDAKRLAQSRLDCLPCLRVPYRDTTGGFFFRF